MSTANPEDHKAAARIAEHAGQLLLVARDSGLLQGKALGAVGDAISNTFITRIVRETHPHDGVLSEEDKDDEARLGKQRVWIIDPLDGTREYSEQRDDWAASQVVPPAETTTSHRPAVTRWNRCLHRTSHQKYAKSAHADSIVLFPLIRLETLWEFYLHSQLSFRSVQIPSNLLSQLQEQTACAPTHVMSQCSLIRPQSLIPHDVEWPSVE
jgi:hypothetical protein